MASSDILAEAQIRSLVIRERFYRDACQWKKLRECYHPDASQTLVDISWYHGDADGFVRRSEEMAKAGTSSLHTIQPAEITLNGDKAFSQSVGTISTRMQRDSKEYELISRCRMLSKLRLVGQRWYMLSMEVIYLQDSIVPVIPESFTSDADFARAISGKRKSYQLLAWVLEEHGLTINNKLPGSDDRESVEKVLGTNEAWLFS
ncbi:SnoaL-like domain-containing protein [Cladophialophora immunda]|nr:SnoaL-like domain-containing protein [Cladophialophora immunda]